MLQFLLLPCMQAKSEQRGMIEMKVAEFLISSFVISFDLSVFSDCFGGAQERALSASAAHCDDFTLIVA